MKTVLLLLLITLSEATIGVFVKLTDGRIPIQTLNFYAILTGVDRTWGSCGAFSVCDGQPTIENCGPCDGYSVSPFGRPPHPSALSHAGIGNVID